MAAGNAALPALIANLAFEVAPIRVNLIAAGFVDTPLSASLLGDDLDKRRDQLRATLPIGRVVEPADVAALAVHIMTNTALTGATYDIDGGQQLVSGADEERPRCARASSPRRCLTMEYLVTMTTHVPDGTPEQAVQDIRTREAAHSRELAAAGTPAAPVAPAAAAGRMAHARAVRRRRRRPARGGPRLDAAAGVAHR